METDEKKRIGALLIFAALIRILYLYLYSRQSIWSDIVVDSLYHLNWADSIAAGDIVGQQTYFRAPLYIYVLALCRALTPDSIMLPRILGSALGVASIFLTYMLARRSAPGVIGRNIGLVAGALQALYPSVIFFEAELLVDFLFAFLLQLSLYRLLVANENGSISAYLTAGLTLGLACLTRPTALALIPCFAMFAYFARRWAFINLKSPAEVGPTKLRATLALLFAALLVIAPITLRNYIVGGDFTLVASSGGVNLFIGNNPDSNPISASLPEPYGPNWTLSDMTGLAELHEGRQLTPAEVSHSWTVRAVEWMIANPLQFISDYATKLYLAFDETTYSNNRSLNRIFADNAILKYSPLGFAALLFLTLVGLSCLASARIPKISRIPRILRIQWPVRWPTIAATTAGMYILIISLFFITERFRLPALLLLFPAAGVGAVALWNLVAARLWRLATAEPKDSLAVSDYMFPRASVAALLVAGLAGGVSLLPIGKPSDSSLGRAEYLAANGYLYSGDLDRAVGAFHELLQLNPRYPRAALNLGVAYFLSAEPDSARLYFKRELQRSPQNPEALTNLASLALTQQDFFLADSLSTLAYQIRPYDLATWRVRIRSLRATEQYQEAKQSIAESELMFGADPSYWYERMRFHLSLTPADNESSLAALRRGFELDPFGTQAVENSDWAFTRNDNKRQERLQSAALIRYQLGYISGLAGGFDSAIVYSAEAIQLDSSLSAAYVNLTLGYLSLGQLSSAREVYQTALGRFDTSTISATSKEDLQRLREIMDRIP